MENDTYYMWREVAIIDGEVMWLTPHADPKEHKFPFDFKFDTPKQAVNALDNYDVTPEEYDEWILVEVVETKVDRNDIPLRRTHE